MSEDAAGLVDLLPSSDSAQCETCGSLEIPSQTAHKNKALGPDAPSDSKAGVPTSRSASSSDGQAELANVAAQHREAYPLDAPPCEGISAYIITVFDQSEHSVASLSSDPQRQAVRRREGQRFGKYRVAKIGVNRRRLSSAVWLEHEAGVCQVLLRAAHPRREKSIDLALRSRERRERVAERKARIAERKVRIARRKASKKRRRERERKRRRR